MRAKTVVVLFMDTGRNYLSKIFSDDWMRQNGFLERFAARRLSDVVRARMGDIPPLVAIGPRDKVGAAIDTMQRYGISQLPVFEDPENPTGDAAWSAAWRNAPCWIRCTAIPTK